MKFTEEFVKNYLLKEIQILKEMNEEAIDLMDQVLVQGSLSQAEKMYSELFSESTPPAVHTEIPQYLN